ACLHLSVREARAGFGILASGRSEAPRVRGRGSLPIALVAEDVAELEQERACSRTFGIGLELQIEELLNHVQLAEVPVDVASGFQALDEGGVELVGVLEMLERLHAGEKVGLEDAPQVQVELRLG